MGLVDKFKTFIGYSDDYYDDELPQTPDRSEEQERYPASGEPDMTVVNGGAYGVPERPNKVVNIHATTQLQVVLVKPERFEDASGIADHLNAKRTIVLNLESANKDVTRRLIDFLSGVAYANNGQIKRVANSTYIITPYNVGIMGDLLDELESSGVFF